MKRILLLSAGDCDYDNDHATVLSGRSKLFMVNHLGWEAKTFRIKGGEQFVVKDGVLPGGRI